MSKTEQDVAVSSRCECLKEVEALQREWDIMFRDLERAIEERFGLPRKRSRRPEELKADKKRRYSDRSVACTIESNSLVHLILSTAPTSDGEIFQEHDPLSAKEPEDTPVQGPENKRTKKNTDAI